MPEKLKPENEQTMVESIYNSIWFGGKFVGHKKTLIKTEHEKFPYAIIHQCDLFGRSSELYENLNDAVYDFIELMKVYG